MTSRYTVLVNEVRASIQGVARRAGVEDAEFLDAMLDDVDYPEIASRINAKAQEVRWARAVEESMTSKRVTPVLLITQYPDGTFSVAWPDASRLAPATHPNHAAILDLLNRLGVTE